MDDEDNKNLWKAFTLNIKPMKRDMPLVKDTKREASFEKTVDYDTRFFPKTQNDIKPPFTNNKINKKGLIDGHIEKKLKKGKLPVEAILDLHGMTQNQAQQRLIGFVNFAVAENKRCVLVITGKGRRSHSSQGILKTKLPLWLAIEPLKSQVITHYAAHLKHGGSGAYYLYLRNQKKV
jgi:DNA-nicking Smr family endonuclease